MQWQGWLVVMALVTELVAAGAGAESLPVWPQHLESDPGEAVEMCLARDCPATTETSGRTVVEGGGLDSLDTGAGKPSLLSRQSEIMASIMLLERQLRQAELISRLMEIYGPDSMIEMLPGQYRTFAASPAGERVAAELETLRYQRRINRLRLEAEIRAAEGQAGGMGVPLVETVAGSEAMEQTPVVQVQEISGVAGTFEARVRVGEEAMVLVTGDPVEGLGVVTVVDQEGVVIRTGDEEARYTLDR